MPQLSAFRALRYNPLAVPDAGTVLCPPYDVIGPLERESLAARDPRNAVHVELPVAGGGSAGGDEGPYQAAAATFAGWQSDGSLRRDERPMIYVYEQAYRLADGTAGAARGFFCRLRLEDFGPQSGVRRHERTMGAPKEDRHRLLSAVRANVSPVLLLFRAADGGGRSARLLDSLSGAEPAMDATDGAGNRHRLWTADPSTSPQAAELLAMASAKPLTIADGHHRYETALRYRDEQRAVYGTGRDAGHEHVLVLLYDADSGGLSVVPTHRLLRGLDPARLLRGAGRLFGFQSLDRAETLVARLPLAAGSIGLWTREGGALLTVDRARIDVLVAEHASPALRWLEVSVLDATLGALTGTPAAEFVADGRMSYSKDGHEAVEQVGRGEADAVFLLPPTKIEAVLEVAAAGEVMPQKSTYFLPKAATGLLYNPLDE